MDHMLFNPLEVMVNIADELFPKKEYEIIIIHNNEANGFRKPNTNSEVLYHVGDIEGPNSGTVIAIHGTISIDLIPYYVAHGIAHAVTGELHGHSKEFYIALKTILDHYHVSRVIKGSYELYFPDYSSFDKCQSIEFSLLRDEGICHNESNIAMNIYSMVESNHKTKLLPQYQEDIDNWEDARHAMGIGDDFVNF